MLLVETDFRKSDSDTNHKVICLLGYLTGTPGPLSYYTEVHT